MCRPQQTEQLTLFMPTASAGELTSVPLLERLVQMQQLEGFSPTSRDELNESFGLLAFMTVPGGTAKHLAEVATHQVKYEADPEAAASSITRKYAGFAQRARTDETQLGTLKEEIADQDGRNPLCVIETEALLTAVGPFVRHLDLRELGRTRDLTRFPFLPLKGYDKSVPPTYDPYVVVPPNQQIAQRIQEVLAGTRVWEARRGIEEAIVEQHSRKRFWIERVSEVEAGQTGRVRLVARDALRSLGVRP